MNDAPDRIWVFPAYRDKMGAEPMQITTKEFAHSAIEYTRTDLCAAAIARAEKAEAECRKLALEILQNHTEIFGLSEERDALRAQIDALQEALIWCSGSNDFNDGGIARKGWQKICAPLLPSIPEKGTTNAD